ncbi:MAG: hypothetical protein V7K48_12330 [Nostoc sp.]|uniref:hypothetical protein n=1 Tax=Nostoc sp. TaxID=1180 RepID=UPI002FFC2D34
MTQVSYSYPDFWRSLLAIALLRDGGFFSIFHAVVTIFMYGDKARANKFAVKY